MKLDALMREEHHIASHRFSWIINFGEIPDGLHVHCDNPKCVNPKHLFLGTPKDNMTDKKEKGRSERGEKNTFSKLKEFEVLEIRQLWKTGKYFQKEIAKMYGINANQVSRIVNKKRWSFLP